MAPDQNIQEITDQDSKENPETVPAAPPKGKKAGANTFLVLRFLLYGMILVFISFHIASPPEIRPQKQEGPFPVPPKQTMEIFPEPRGLSEAVLFWTDIFAKYSRNQVVIHDSRYLNVVYEVIDVRKGRSGWKKVRQAKAGYKRMLKQMAANWDSPNSMTLAQRKLYARFAAYSDIPGNPKKYAYRRVRSQQGQADSIAIGIKRSGRYIEQMETIFQQNDLPTDLVCLPLVESAFNTYSLSYVGASGMWQIMEHTARQYGLRIDRYIDERRDPILATHAAARLLKHNYNVAKSWPIAITAYNHGLQGMINAARGVNSYRITDIINHYDGRRFGFASRNFYPEFLAARDVYKNRKKYFPDVELDPPFTIVQMTLPDYIPPDALESYCGIRISDFRRLNPALKPAVFRKGGLLPKNYPINVHSLHKQFILAGYKNIPEKLRYAALPWNIRHKILKNQTLSEIAKKYQTSVSEIVSANGLSNPRHIRAGQVLVIPGKPNTKKRPKTHLVKRGQTLEKIASMYNISQNEIVKLNAISNPGKIRSGQKLKIP